MRKRAICDLGSFTGGVRESISTPKTHALGGGKSLGILPCSTGSYNLIGLVFVVDGTRIAPPNSMPVRALKQLVRTLAPL